MEHNRTIARAFSSGKFKAAESFLSNEVDWFIYGEGKHFKGKNQLSDFCRNFSDYFQSATTHFHEYGLIEDDHTIAIYGNARYIRNSEVINEMNSCDVYVFDTMGMVETIRSYCISKK